MISKRKKIKNYEAGYKKYESFDKLCMAILNEHAEQGGSMRKIQFEKISEAYKIIHKKGKHPFFVKKRDSIVPRVDRRENKRGIFKDDIDTIVKYVINSKQYSYSFAELYDAMYQDISEDSICNQILEDVSYSMRIPKDKLANDIESKLISILFTSLKRLAKNGIIDYEKSWLIYDIDKSSVYYNDEDGAQQIITDIHSQVLNEYHIKNEYMLYKEHRTEILDFYIDIELCLEELGISAGGRVYEMRMNENENIPSYNDYENSCKNLSQLLIVWGKKQISKYAMERIKSLTMFNSLSFLFDDNDIDTDAILREKAEYEKIISDLAS